MDLDAQKTARHIPEVSACSASHIERKEAEAIVLPMAGRFESVWDLVSYQSLEETLRGSGANH